MISNKVLKFAVTPTASNGCKKHTARSVAKARTGERQASSRSRIMLVGRRARISENSRHFTKWLIKVLHARCSGLYGQLLTCVIASRCSPRCGDVLHKGYFNMLEHDGIMVRRHREIQLSLTMQDDIMT
mmetsp:Transcript_11214/g.30180  ORF Transcript_11214/g.30180 Transcript_11214/m.30180 type:complete len:129 (-) Transcript_11214:235-621(-)